MSDTKTIVFDICLCQIKDKIGTVKVIPLPTSEIECGRNAEDLLYFEDYFIDDLQLNLDYSFLLH